MWWRSRRRRGGADAPPEVVVVTREGCHLCGDMLAVVEAELGPEAKARTLDVDVALAEGEVTKEQHERWTTLVPVLLVDGQEVAHYRVEPAELGRLLGKPGGGRGAARS